MDQRRSWFDAIRNANAILVSRLLYSTPAPEAGIDRLAWTVSAGATTDGDNDKWLAELAATVTGTLLEGKHADRVQFVAAVSSTLAARMSVAASQAIFLHGIDGLSLAILLYFGDAVRSTRRKEVMDALVGATPAHSPTLATVWGNNNTALHLAALFEDKNLYEALITRGADPTCLNQFGLAPNVLLDAATVRDLVEVKRKFLLGAMSRKVESAVPATPLASVASKEESASKEEPAAAVEKTSVKNEIEVVEASATASAEVPSVDNNKAHNVTAMESDASDDDDEINLDITADALGAIEKELLAKAQAQASAKPVAVAQTTLVSTLATKTVPFSAVASSSTSTKVSPLKLKKRGDAMAAPQVVATAIRPANAVVENDVAQLVNHVASTKSNGTASPTPQVKVENMRIKLRKQQPQRKMSIPMAVSPCADVLASSSTTGATATITSPSKATLTTRINDIPVVATKTSGTVTGDGKTVTTPQHGAPSKVMKRRQITPRSNRSITPISAAMRALEGSDDDDNDDDDNDDDDNKEKMDMVAPVEAVMQPMASVIKEKMDEEEATALEKFETSMPALNAVTVDSITLADDSTPISTGTIKKRRPLPPMPETMPTYTTTVKTDGIVLMDGDAENILRPASPKKNVSFGNSWKGTLESKRSYVKMAAIESANREVQAVSPLKGAVMSKLLLKFVSIRGLVMHLAKQPDATSFYCVITTSTGEQHFTKPFQYITENQHVTVPLHDELALLVDGDATVTVELRLRAEYRKAPRFNPQRMLRSASIRKMVHRASSSMGHYGSGSVAASNDTSTSVIASVQEETLCRIEMNVRELQQSCSASGVPVERKWTWKPAERFANADVASVMGGDNGRRRSHTRSQSRIMEVGHYLFSKFSSNSSSSDKSSVSSATTLERRPSSRASRMSFSMPAASDLASSIDLVEAGTLQMQVYCVGGLKSHAECALVPGKMSAVEAWLAQKQWFKTTWHKGYLSQQGGDVKNWRRRYFKIVGTKMEAYHEFTKEHRTTIDLSQATELKPLNLRCDNELYPMKFSFRLHFKHGEHIDFYADAEEKYSEWMRVLMKVLADRPAEEAQWIGEVEEARSSLGSNSGKTDGSSSKARRPGVAEIQWNDPAASHAATDNKHWESASADSMDDEERQLAAAMDAPMGKKLAGAVKLPVLTMKPPTLPPRAKMAGPSGIDALADRFATVTTITMNEPFVCNPIEEEQEEEGQDQSERRISAAVSDVERRRSVGLFGSMKSSQNRYRRSIV